MFTCSTSHGKGSKDEKNNNYKKEKEKDRDSINFTQATTTYRTIFFIKSMI